MLKNAFIIFFAIIFSYSQVYSSTLNGTCRITGYISGSPPAPCEYTYSFTSGEISYSECRSYLTEVDGDFCRANAPRPGGCIEEAGYVLSAYCTGGGGGASSFTGEVESWFKGSWLDTGNWERGQSFFSKHYSDSFHDWSEEARERWRSYLYRNAIAKETGIAVWQDNPFYEYLEWFYRALKLLSKSKDNAVSVFPKLDDEPQSEVALKYELDYALLPLSSERESLFEIGSLFEPPELSGDNERQLFCSAENPGSIAPYFGIRYSSLYGKHIESSDITLAKAGERFIFSDGSGSKIAFKPYTRFSGLERKIYFMGPIGSKYRLRYENDGKGGKFLIESADNYVIELGTKTKENLWHITKMTAPDKSWLEYSYNGNGLKAIKDSHSREYKFERDSEGKVISFEDSSGKKSYFEYDSDKNLVAINRAGKTARYSYGNGLLKSIDNGIKQTFNYDNKGRLISSEYEGGINRIERYYEDKSSRVVITDGLGARTEYEYETIRGRKEFKKIKDSEGNIWLIENSKDGSKQTIINPAGNIVEITKNESGNPVYIKDALGNGTTIEYVKRYDYTEFGRHKVEYSDLVSAIIGPSGRKIEYKYDKNSNLVELKTPIAVTKYEYDRNNHLKAVIDGEGRKWRYENGYSSKGLLDKLRITDPAGNGTEYSYNKAGIEWVKDAKGNYTKFGYDDSGNILFIEDSYKGRIEFGYGGESCANCGTDKVTSLKGGAGNIWRYEYDKYGRLTGAIDPIGRKKIYSYDIMSKLVKEEYYSGNDKDSELNYEYDRAGRIKKKASGDNFAEYKYDAAGNLTDLNSGNEKTSYKYDANNRLIKENSLDFWVEYSYNGAGDKIKAINPHYKLEYRYNSGGNLTQIVNSTSGLTIEYNYDKSGLVTGKKIIKAEKILNSVRYSYDRAGKLIKIEDENNGKRTDLVYEYDENGNIIKKEDRASKTEYRYDKLNRIISARYSNGAKEGFMYDSNGNRTNDRYIRKYRYNGANQLLENSKYNYEYDFKGNLTKKTEKQTGLETKYTYDSWNRLIEVTNSSWTVKFNYDATGRRISKEVRAKTGAIKYEKYLYDGNNLIAMLDKENKVIATFTYGKDIDEPLIITMSDGKNYIYHTDHLGSITQITNEKGEVVETYEYKTYGEPTIKDASENVLTKSVIGNPFMFTSREYDTETGLYFYRSRYYDPEIGRFIQEDPIGFSGGDINLYAYVSNNPINYKDPYGTIGIKPIIIALSELYKLTLTYGNYGGGWWTDGEYSFLNKQPNKTPIDSMDRCFMEHDIAYTKYNISPLTIGCKNKKEIDEKLVECLKNLNEDPRKWEEPASNEIFAIPYRQVAIFWFSDWNKIFQSNSSSKINTGAINVQFPEK